MTDIKITPEIRAHLAALENENGQLTPAMVVDDAREKMSPLHDLFDWDVKSAAMKHWLYQARTIIHSVRLIASGSETVTLSAPHYVRDPSLSGRDQGYVSIERLRRDPIQAGESLRLEFGRAESALTRALAIAEALGLTQEIEQLIERLSSMRHRLEEQKADRQQVA